MKKLILSRGERVLGLTLVEVLLVVSVTAIVAAITAVSMSDISSNIAKAKLESDVDTIKPQATTAKEAIVSKVQAYFFLIRSQPNIRSI